MSENEEHLSVLPQSWIRVSLKECSLRITDGTHQSPKFVDQGIPFIFVKHIVQGSICFENTKFISESTYQTLNTRCPVEVGDILYSAVGSYGVAVPVRTEQPFSFQRHIAHIKPVSSLSQLYLVHYLNSPVCRQQAHLVARGVAQKTVTLGSLTNFSVPIPPLAEQHRIVNKIEELFTELDAGVDLLKKLKIKLKRYRQSVLKAAVEGKLTEAWREAHEDELEPASVLLERILAERREKWEAEQLAKMEAKGKVPKNDKWKLKYKEPPTPQENDFLDLPEEWSSSTIGQLSVLVQYGSSSKTNLDSSGVPVLRMGNIVDGKLVFEKLKYLPKDHPEFPALLLEAHDILFNRTNSAELVGKTSVYEGQLPHCSFASYLIRVRVHPRIEPSFVSNYINSIYGRQWLNSVVSQQVGQANVNGTKLQALTIPLPPQREQEQIFDRVEHLFSILTELEKVVDKNLKRAEKLRQGILKKAFEGRLETQDSNDEPASVLLGRIQAEKNQKEIERQGKKKAKTKKKKTPTNKQLKLVEVPSKQEAK